MIVDAHPRSEERNGVRGKDSFFIGVGGTITIDTFYDNESLEKAASNHRLASRLLILQ